MNPNNLVELANQQAEEGLFQFNVPADTSAGQTTAETPIWHFSAVDNTPLPLGSVVMTPAGNLTSGAVANATIQLWKRTNGGPRTSLASGTTSPTGLGSLASFVPVNLALEVGASISPGDDVLFTITKQSSGQQLPAFHVGGFIL